MPKKWVNRELKIPSAELVKAAGSEILAKLLLQRGVDTPEKAENFLNPETIVPVSPYAYNDMQIAVDRIKKAIENQEHILVYGDFDADGVTATAVMHKTLNVLGALYSHYIPDRQTESHGMKKDILLKKIAKEKVKTVITVDCGITDIEQVALVKSFGVDVIITDHHEAQAELPNAVAILDAKAQGALKEDLPIDDINSLTSMAGVGAAFKLCCALLQEYDKTQLIEELLPLVAVGTVADIMQLRYENRLFVTLGMKLISEGKNFGISELLRTAGVNPEEELTADKIAFTVAPRINAAGRLENAETSFKLLTSANEAEIGIYTQNLNNLNKMRQQLADNIYAEALEYIEKNGNDEDAVIFAYNPNWHIGIVGIVASRLTETFNKPAFMFTDSPDGNSYRASVRSVEGINIFNVLEMNSDYMTSFGGHTMAAGLSIEKTLISIDEFKKSINSTVLEMTDGQVFQPELEIDLEVSAKDLTLELLEDLKKLEPCGEGNPYPVFAIKNMKLLSEKTLGSENNHLKFTCLDKGGDTVECVYWKHTSLNIPVESELDVAFCPKLNEFNGTKALRLEVKDYNSENIVASSQKPKRKIIDHRKKTGILAQVADYIRTSKNSFKIFAENKAIIEELSGFEEISNNIINRLTVEKTQQLMFFDYPPDKKLLNYLINKSDAQIIHFMNYAPPEADIDEIISKVSGMLKYAAKKYAGIVFLPDISTALAVSDELIMLVVKLLNRTGVIKVTAFENDRVHFEFCTSIRAEEIKKHEVYEQSRMELFKERNFRRELTETDNLKKFLL